MLRSRRRDFVAPRGLESTARYAVHFEKSGAAQTMTGQELAKGYIVVIREAPGRK